MLTKRLVGQDIAKGGTGCLQLHPDAGKVPVNGFDSEFAQPDFTPVWDRELGEPIGSESVDEVLILSLLKKRIAFRHSTDSLISEGQLAS